MDECTTVFLTLSKINMLTYMYLILFSLCKRQSAFKKGSKERMLKQFCRERASLDPFYMSNRFRFKFKKALFGIFSNSIDSYKSDSNYKVSLMRIH